MEDDLNIFKMEDNLNFFKGRRPQFFSKMEDDPKQNNATKTIKSKNNNILERRPQFVLKKEDDLNIFENGRRPQKTQCNLKQLKVKTMIVVPLRVT